MRHCNYKYYQNIIYFSFLTILHIYFKNGCTNMHSYQQLPISMQSFQDLLWDVLLIFHYFNCSGFERQSHFHFANC